MHPATLTYNGHPLYAAGQRPGWLYAPSLLLHVRITATHRAEIRPPGPGTEARDELVIYRRDRDPRQSSSASSTRPAHAAPRRSTTRTPGWKHPLMTVTRATAPVTASSRQAPLTTSPEGARTGGGGRATAPGAGQRRRPPCSGGLPAGIPVHPVPRNPCEGEPLPRD